LKDGSWCGSRGGLCGESGEAPDCSSVASDKLFVRISCASGTRGEESRSSRLFGCESASTDIARVDCVSDGGLHTSTDFITCFT
jgi:hypothetical protein